MRSFEKITPISCGSRPLTLNVREVSREQGIEGWFPLIIHIQKCLNNERKADSIILRMRDTQQHPISQVLVAEKKESNKGRTRQYFSLLVVDEDVFGGFF
ncbi:hypothetical protein B5807_12190 [Epicoccum nigrum]|uniref:Uncharacterized protein n=1 Tax=Epicoccum nigrum TaxID=105696 RepID=A0A1Y2LI70_EPING|nr:hypothetical protein B5807_12190 [Epicoccum nigrum]